MAGPVEAQLGGQGCPLLVLRHEVAAKRQARLVGLAFADLDGYLRTRRVRLGWSVRRMAAELHVAPAWLKRQMGTSSRSPDPAGGRLLHHAADVTGAGGPSPGMSLTDALRASEVGQN
jgi:hypothetical protein